MSLAISPTQVFVSMRTRAGGVLHGELEHLQDWQAKKDFGGDRFCELVSKSIVIFHFKCCCNFNLGASSRFIAINVILQFCKMKKCDCLFVVHTTIVLYLR